MNIASSSEGISHFRVRKLNCYLVTNPDYIRDIFLNHYDYFHKGRVAKRIKYLFGEGVATVEGEEHRHQRKIAQPAFHTSQLPKYFNSMEHIISRLFLKKTTGDIIDVHVEMQRLTLAIVARALFSVDIESEYKEFGQAVTKGMALMSKLFIPITAQWIIPPLIQFIQFRKIHKKICSIIDNIIHNRLEKNLDEKPDLLSKLIQSSREENKNQKLNYKKLRDQCITILILGHETVSNVLSWTWYLLSINPSIEEKFHKEIDSTLEGQSPTFEDLKRLNYTRLLLKESMRLYPPAWMLSRVPFKEFKIANQNISPGSIMILSQYVMHHDPKFFPDPYNFEPERWVEGSNRASNHPYAYFPFGGGPHGCVAESFAMAEGIFILSAVGQKWRLKPVLGHPIEANPGATLRPKYGLPLILETR